MRFFQLLRQVVVNLDLPYGYTLSIWAAGAIAAMHFGAPQMLDIFLFVLGALTSYIALALLTYSTGGRSPSPVRGMALLNALAVIPAVTVSLLPNFIASRELGIKHEPDAVTRQVPVGAPQSAMPTTAAEPSANRALATMRCGSQP